MHIKIQSMCDESDVGRMVSWLLEGWRVTNITSLPWVDCNCSTVARDSNREISERYLAAALLRAQPCTENRLFYSLQPAEHTYTLTLFIGCLAWFEHLNLVLQLLIPRNIRFLPIQTPYFEGQGITILGSKYAPCLSLFSQSYSCKYCIYFLYWELCSALKLAVCLPPYFDWQSFSGL